MPASLPCPQTRGYFSQPTPPVGSVGPAPINYWKIYCRDEYNLVVNKKYKELEVGVCTAVAVCHAQ